MVAKLTDNQCQEIVDAFRQTFNEDNPRGNKAKAAKLLGVAETTYKARFKIAESRGFVPDTAVLGAMNAVGTDMVPDGLWLKTDGYSVYLRPPKGEAVDLRNAVTEAIEGALVTSTPSFTLNERHAITDADDAGLLVIDVADVHFGKFSVISETGHGYDRNAARFRLINGVDRLVAKAKVFGIHRILFVLGDDVLHVDNAQGTTTSGTRQDTEGSIFDMFKDAFAAFREAIEECAKVADVDLIHVPSNHDWVMGWALSQTIASWFKDHPNVHASVYNMSERHRKYYRFGSNLIGLSHGDGAKEQQLYACMVTEAREHISECKNLYWLLHHVHHKIRKQTGLKTELREKDLAGMTVVRSAGEVSADDGPSIEYVRSPSPPDSWHDRNGFINRQAVECFMYHPHDGQTVRFTEWF